MLRIIELIGKVIIDFSEGLGEILILLFLTIKQLILPPLEIRNTFKQMLEIGVRSCTYTGLIVAGRAGAAIAAELICSKVFSDERR
jgi:ABC-type transporter Mla maintaining outer membrane lipid asymmetry permease subunit MlaE